MTSVHTVSLNRRLQQLLAAVTLASLLMTGPAWAVDFVQATAFQNLDPITFVDNNTGSTASAQKEYVAGSQGSAASTSRTSTEAIAYGFGATVTTHYDASSSTRSAFTLWDLASNTALPSAAGLGLSFNFTLSGNLTVGPTSLSSAGLTYEAEVRNAINAVSQERLGNLTSTYGPGPGGAQYVNVGDLTLLGNFVQSFSLLHTAGDLYGTLFMSSVTLASNVSQSLVGLNLDSITLATGVAPLGGLGVRLDQTGQIIPVSAVPEPATWAMWLVGVAALGALRRGRQG
jgi:MYXO-CTERM domain-containing protein